MIEKGTIYFNIFECSRNILDQLDVTYQRALIATPVPEGHYMPSPARERYYDTLSKILINSTVGSDRTINNVSLTRQSLNLNMKRKQGIKVTYLI